MLQTFERVNRLRIAYRFVGRRPGDTVVTYADPKRASHLLGWQAQLGLDDMCRDAWNWQTPMATIEKMASLLWERPKTHRGDYRRSTSSRCFTKHGEFGVRGCKANWKKCGSIMEPF